MSEIYWILRGLFTALVPWSPRARKLRIAKLMEDSGKSREDCAFVVYSRDLINGYDLSTEELADYNQIKLNRDKAIDNIAIEESNEQP